MMMTALEGLHFEEKNNAASITSKEIAILNQKEYDELMAQPKENLVRIIMGEQRFYFRQDYT